MIKVRITDARALAARTPEELSAYLRSTGWRLAGHQGRLATWVRSAGVEGEFEILQPTDSRSRDYAARVGDAVTTLAVAEARSEMDVFRDIAEAPKPSV